MRLDVLSVTLALALAACAGHPERVTIVPPPSGPPAPTPINAGLSPAAALWHLRTGLNVAALACRGPDEAALTASYNALLASRAAPLAEAQARYAAEYEAEGGDWRERYDDDQTRLYNFWGQPRGRERLCNVAPNALTALAGADAAALPEVATVQLARLDRAFAPPRIEVDARVFTGPTKVMVALR